MAEAPAESPAVLKAPELPGALSLETADVPTPLVVLDAMAMLGVAVASIELLGVLDGDPLGVSAVTPVTASEATWLALLDAVLGAVLDTVASEAIVADKLPELASLAELGCPSVAVLDPPLAVLDTKELLGLIVTCAESLEVLEPSTELLEVLVAEKPRGLLSLEAFSDALLELSEATSLADRVTLVAVDVSELLEPALLGVRDGASLGVVVSVPLEALDTKARFGVIVAADEPLEAVADSAETVELSGAAEEFAGPVEVLDT